MDSSATSVDINQFKNTLNSTEPNKYEIELHKFNDYLDDLSGAVGNKSSFLGGLFGYFKKLLQEENFFAGLVGCFKRITNQKDESAYNAFWNDHKVFDDLSNYYGNRFRGAFIFNYMMGAIAVLVALIPVGFSLEKHAGHDESLIQMLLTAIEFVIILSILFIYKIGANHSVHHSQQRTNPILKINRRWQERWLEYRLLAERFRYMEILYPIGIDPRNYGVAKQDGLGEWINAYFAMRLDTQETLQTNDLNSYKNRLLSVMKSQHSYHEKNALRSERIHHRLHTLATWMFYGTLVACALHFFWHNSALTLFAGFFPAVAAAMHGIIASCEFIKTKEVSERMYKQIKKLIQRLDINPDEGNIRRTAIEFYYIVIGETQNWKFMFMDKNVPR